VFDGAQAAEMGLVTNAVPVAQLDEAVDAVVASLLTGAAQGLRETKALLARDLVDRIDARGDEVAALSARLFGSDEAREAMLAFLAKKK
jgi:enoyl-CoA hydratase/methylglutaconyl-CoA hydratase